MEIKEFIEEVRECNECNIDVTPLIAGSNTSKIFVVSEKPPNKEIHEEFGRYWKRDGLIPVFGACIMLGIVDELNNKNFFWMHTANCDRGNAKICSNKFLKKGIELVSPELILIFGVKAASFFFKEKFENIVGLRKWDTYDCIVLPHFSGAARQWHNKYKDEIKTAKSKIREILNLT